MSDFERISETVQLCGWEVTIETRHPMTDKVQEAADDLTSMASDMAHCPEANRNIDLMGEAMLRHIDTLLSAIKEERAKNEQLRKVAEADDPEPPMYDDESDFPPHSPQEAHWHTAWRVRRDLRASLPHKEGEE